MNRHFLSLSANILWFVVIFALCAMPPQDIPEAGIDIPHLDKVVHYGMFFILSLLICFESTFLNIRKKRKIYLIAISVSFFYGGLIEILQYYFFNRGCDVWDWLADMAGGVCGCFFYPTASKLKDRFLSGKRSFK